jgi:hypothetical protein
MTFDGVVILNPSVVTLNEVKSLRSNSVKDLELKRVTTRGIDPKRLK